MDPCELSVFEEQQDFHVWPIVDDGNHCQLVKSTGFVDGLEASATDRVDRL